MRFGTLCLVAAGAVMLIAAPAQAHRLTEAKAKAALKPVAAEMATTIAPLVAQKLPGATVGKSSVSDCQITKKSHRAECIISYAIAGAATGETECALEALVRFKSARSKQLKIAVAPVLVCFFPVPLA